MTLSYARFWRKDSKVVLAVGEDGLEANIQPVDRFVSSMRTTA